MVYGLTRLGAQIHDEPHSWRAWHHRCGFRGLNHMYWSLSYTFNAYNKEYRDIVFKSTFNNISAISWRLVVLVEETGVPGESHWPTASHWQTLSHERDSTLTTLVMIGTNCIGSVNSATIWSRPWSPLQKGNLF